MGNVTSSQVKNSIGRSLSELVSRSPNDKEKKEIWDYFKYKCAYCNKNLSKGEGHLDHIIPFKECGKNGKYNRALSCSQCNSKEKLDKHWKEFLKSKCKTEKEFTTREKRIEEWINKDTEIVSPELLEKMESIEKRINNQFSSGYEELKNFINTFNGSN